MGPVILLDKSTLQCLSQEEIHFLFKHYYIAIAPILIIEILADLKKNTRDNTLSKKEVTILSKKLLSRDSQINAHYMSLCIRSLLGIDVPMTAQIVLVGGKEVQTRDGGRGIFFNEPVERRSLINWQGGKFSESEKILARQWREATQSLDLEVYKRNFEKKLSEILINRADNLTKLGLDIEKSISNPDSDVQFTLLGYFTDEYHIPQQLKNVIYDRWLKEEMKSFKEFAPYAYYCLKANMIFHYGLAYNLITPRRTNRIDLEYLYYLPFCMVFSSGDKFHKYVTPLLLRDDQEFIDRDVLKNDLQWLSSEWRNLSKKEKQKRFYDYGSYPPFNEGSITYRLWRKYMKPWEPGSGHTKMTKEEEARFTERLKAVLDVIDKY